MLFMSSLELIVEKSVVKCYINVLICTYINLQNSY